MNHAITNYNTKNFIETLIHSTLAYHTFDQQKKSDYSIS